LIDCAAVSGGKFFYYIRTCKTLDYKMAAKWQCDLTKLWALHAAAKKKSNGGQTFGGSVVRGLVIRGIYGK